MNRLWIYKCEECLLYLESETEQEMKLEKELQDLPQNAFIWKCCNQLKCSRMNEAGRRTWEMGKSEGRGGRRNNQYYENEGAVDGENSILTRMQAKKNAESNASQQQIIQMVLYLTSA